MYVYQCVKDKVELIKKRVYSLQPVVKWLILVPLKPSKKEVLQVCLFQFFNSLFQMIGFVLVIKFVSLLLNNNWDISLLGYSYNVAPYKVPLFWAVVGVSFFCILFGAFLNFWARKKTAHLARKTEERLLLDATKAYTHTFSNTGGTVPDIPDPTTFKTFYSRGGRFAGRMVMAATSALVPFFIMCCSLCFLLYINFWLTLLLLTIIAVGGPIFIKIAQHGRQAADNLLFHARNATIDRNAYIDSLRYAPCPPEPNDAHDEQWINKTEAVTNFMGAYEKRLHITALSTFFTQAVIALLLAAILLSVVYPAIVGESVLIVSLLVYITAFKFFGSGLTATVNALVTLNVFYSYCHKLVPFLEATFSSNQTETRPVGDNSANAAAGQQFSLLPSQPFFISLQAPLDWSTIPCIVTTLAPHLKGGEDISAAPKTLLNSHHDRFPHGMDTRINTLQKHEAKRIEKKLIDISAKCKILKKQLRYFNIVNGLNNPPLPRELRLFLHALLLQQKYDRGIFFIDGIDFLYLSKELQHLLIETISDFYIFIVLPYPFKYKHILHYKDQLIAFLSKYDLIWIGSIDEANENNIHIEPSESSSEDISTTTEIFEEM